MTAEEFEKQYAARSGITVEQLREMGRIVAPCHCGEDMCEGWQSTTQERLDEEKAWKVALRTPYLYPLGKFPFTIEFLHPVTQAVVASQTIEAPVDGKFQAVYIPPVARFLGHYVAVRMRFADGEVVEGTYRPNDQQRSKE